MKTRTLITILIASLTPLLAFNQTTPDSKNWKHTGKHRFTQEVVIQTDTINAVKIGHLDNFIANIGDTLDLGSVAVLDSDTTLQKPGHVASRYDFKNEAVKTPLLRILKGFGSTVKLTPLLEVGYPSNNPMIDGRGYYTLSYTADSCVVTGFKFTMATAGNYNSDQYNGIALFSISGGSNGVGTLVSQTADDGAIWKNTASTLVTKALPTPVTIPPGYYHIVCVWNTSDASPVQIPSIHGTTLPLVWNIGQGWTNASNVGFCSYITGQNTLASPFNLSTFTNQSVLQPNIIAY